MRLTVIGLQTKKKKKTGGGGAIPAYSSLISTESTLLIIHC